MPKPVQFGRMEMNETELEIISYYSYDQSMVIRMVSVRKFSTKNGVK